MKIIRFPQRAHGWRRCENCGVAASMWERGKGLLGRAGLAEDEGIWLAPGSSIHMFA